MVRKPIRLDKTSNTNGKLAIIDVFRIVNSNRGPYPDQTAPSVDPGPHVRNADFDSTARNADSYGGALLHSRT
jgi:hypothetical protein